MDVLKKRVLMYLAVVSVFCGLKSECHFCFNLPISVTKYIVTKCVVQINKEILVVHFSIPFP